MSGITQTNRDSQLSCSVWNGSYTMIFLAGYCRDFKTGLFLTKLAMLGSMLPFVELLALQSLL